MIFTAMKRHKNSIDSRLMVLMGIVFLDMLGVTIVIPILPVLFTDFVNGIMPVDISHLSPEVIKALQTNRNILLGWLIASFSIAQFFGSPILGALSDKYGRKKMLSISMVGSLIGFLLFIYGIDSHLIVVLFVARILDGFTGGNVSIVFSAIADISKQEDKSKNFGLVGSAFGLGFILGPFIGGVLSDPHIVSWFDYSIPFYFTSLLMLINLWAVHKYMPETNKYVKESKKKVTIWTGARNIYMAFQFKSLRNLFIVFFLYAFGFNFFTQFYQVFLVYKFSFKQLEIGLIFGWIGLFIIITQAIINRKLSMRYAPSRLVGVFLFTMFLALGLLWIPSQIEWQYALLPIIAISQAMVSPNLMSLISGHATDDRQGEILGINQSVQSLAASIPPIISGYIINIDVTLPIKVSAVLVFLAFSFFITQVYPRESH